MDEFNDNEIAKLLRLKKYEQPAPGYFENFLHEFHRRQRDELLHQPLWKICFQRAQDFMFSLNVPALTSYPVAAAVLLVCAAIVSLKIYQGPETTTNVAVQNRPAFTAPASVEGEWTLASPVATRVFTAQPIRKANESAYTHSRNSGAPPRYVLDSVPVSYETAFRF
jgi:hypothetical protein